MSAPTCVTCARPAFGDGPADDALDVHGECPGCASYLAPAPAARERIVICPRCGGPTLYPRGNRELTCSDGHPREVMVAYVKPIPRPMPRPAPPRRPEPVPRWKLRSS